MRHPTRTGIATLALLLAGASGSVAGAFEIRTIVLTGDEAPGAPFGQDFTTLQFLGAPDTAPIVDENGRVAFNSVSPLGIWIGDGGALEQGLVSQASAPVLGGSIVSVFNVFRGGSGRFVYRVSVSQQLGSSFEVVYAAGPGGFEVISEEGMDAPGTPSVFEFGPNLAPQAGGSGEVAFKGELEQGVNGVTRDDDEGIWAGGAGSPLTLLMREGDPAPGFDPQAQERCTPTPDGSGADPETPVDRLTAQGAEVVLARDGTLAVIATVANCVGPGSTRDVLYIRTPGDLPRVVLVSNTEFPPTGEVVNGMREVAISDSGIVAFTGTNFNGNGLWTARFQTIGPFEELVGELVAEQGDVFPGIPAGSTIETPGILPVVADTGRVTFDAELRNIGSEDDTGLFAAGGGRGDFTFGVEGAPAPELPGFVFGDFEDVLFGTDAAGNIAFLTTLVAAGGGAGAGLPLPPTPTVGLWRSGPTGPVELIAHTGGELEVRGGETRVVAKLSFAGEGGDGVAGRERGGGIGPDGEVAFWAEFEDGSQGIFVAVPEPGVLAMQIAAVFSLALLGRGRCSCA